MADTYTERFLPARIAQESKDIPPGKRGVCSACGYDKPRLINKVCVQCRDEEDKQIARGVRL